MYILDIRGRGVEGVGGVSANFRFLWNLFPCERDILPEYIILKYIKFIGSFNLNKCTPDNIGMVLNEFYGFKIDKNIFKKIHEAHMIIIRLAHLTIYSLVVA